MVVTETKPVISCIMPVYNGDRWLKIAINSILQQTFTCFELIIVNDGSTDGSGDIIDAAAARDTRVTVIHQPNQGIVAALNAGLAVARGKYIARMDADDVAISTRFIRQLAIMNADPRIMILGTGSRTIGPDDSSDGATAPETTEKIRCILGNNKTNRFPPSILQVLHPTTMMRADCIRAIGAYSEEFEHVEDYDLYLRASSAGIIAEIPEILMLYRIHGNNISVRKLHEQEQNAARCDVVRVRDNRQARGLRRQRISGPTFAGWVGIRRYRRERQLGLAQTRALYDAGLLALKGALKTSPSVSLHLLARCAWYLALDLGPWRASGKPGGTGSSARDQDKAFS